jgi:hypothetical protein
VKPIVFSEREVLGRLRTISAIPSRRAIAIAKWSLPDREPKGRLLLFSPEAPVVLVAIEWSRDPGLQSRRAGEWLDNYGHRIECWSWRTSDGEGAVSFARWRDGEKIGGPAVVAGDVEVDALERALRYLLAEAA